MCVCTYVIYVWCVRAYTWSQCKATLYSMQPKCEASFRHADVLLWLWSYQEQNITLHQQPKPELHYLLLQVYHELHSYVLQSWLINLILVQRPLLFNACWVTQIAIYQGRKSCQNHSMSLNSHLQLLRLNIWSERHGVVMQSHWQVLWFKILGFRQIGHTHRQAAESSIFGLGQLSVHSCWSWHWQVVKSSNWLGPQNVIGHTASSTHLHWLASHTPLTQSWGAQYRDKAVEYVAPQTVRSRIKSEYFILFHCKFFFDLSVTLCRSNVVFYQLVWCTCFKWFYSREPSVVVCVPYASSACHHIRSLNRLCLHDTYLSITLFIIMLLWCNFYLKSWYSLNCVLSLSGANTSWLAVFYE